MIIAPASESEAATQALSYDPGPLSALVLSNLDSAQLTRAARLDAVAAWTKLASWVEARRMQALVDAAAPEPATTDPALAVSTDPDCSFGNAALKRWVTEADKHSAIAEIGATLHLAPVTARARVNHARDLLTRFPATYAAMTRGTITSFFAKILTEQTLHIDDDVVLAQIEARVLLHAPTQTVRQYRRVLQRTILELAPQPALVRRADAMAGRHVSCHLIDDDMALLTAVLPAEDAAVVMCSIQAIADADLGCTNTHSTGKYATGKNTATDTRTADQRRADALVQLAAAGLNDPHIPRHQGRRPGIQVTVDLTTLLGLNDRPGELSGYGPISAELARRIAADPTATWRRLVTDPLTGRLLDYGRRQYRPPADLRDYVLARDGTCVFPGCGQPARRCQIDHIDAFPHGATSSTNTAAECRHHHLLKHRGGWRLTTEDGAYRWRAPTGRTYHSTPHSYC